MRFIQWALVGLQASLGLAFPGALRGDSDGLRLFGRQIIEQPPDVIVDDNCRPMCTGVTCRGDGGVCPALRRRWSVSEDDFFDSGNNNSSSHDTGDHDTLHALGKRDFNVEPSSVNTNMQYVMRQFERAGNPDPQFGPVTRTQKFNVRDIRVAWPNPDATVSRQVRFTESQKFQWGTEGLMGCTMLLIVSARAVWMGHLYEVEAFCGFDDLRDHLIVRNSQPPTTFWRICQQHWNEQVVNPLVNTDVINPANRVVSRRIDPDLFNGDEDNTQIIFMTPQDPKNPRNFLYRQKILDLYALLYNDVGITNARALVFPYKPLDPGPADPAQYKTPQQVIDNNLFETTHRGCVLFQ
ncbi:hypothetical protein V8F06_012273 [Rhypophila decipiens]